MARMGQGGGQDGLVTHGLTPGNMEQSPMTRRGWLVATAVLLGLLADGGGPVLALQSTAEDEGIRYLDVTPLDVPLSRGGFIQGHAVIRVSLKVEDQASRTKVEEMRPKLEAAFLMVVTELARYDLEAEAPIDTGLVRQRLQEAADRILGPGVTQVFVIEAMTTR